MTTQCGNAVLPRLACGMYLVIFLFCPGNILQARVVSPFTGPSSRMNATRSSNTPELASSPWPIQGRTQTVPNFSSHSRQLLGWTVSTPFSGESQAACRWSSAWAKSSQTQTIGACPAPSRFPTLSRAGTVLASLTLSTLARPVDAVKIHKGVPALTPS